MKNKLLANSIYFILLIALSSNIFAEHEQMVWGEVNEEDLKMTEYEADPNASILYLGNYSEVFGEDVDYYNYTTYKNFIRIKILTKEGLEYANQKIPYYLGHKEQIKYIEAQSFTLQEDGNIKKTVLEKKDILTEQVNKVLNFKVFSIPNTQVGSIIEFRYKKWTPVQISIDPFLFQGTEPRRWSEIRFHPPKYTAYVTIPTGVLIKGMVEEKSKIRTGTPNSRGETYRYYMENIPAFRPEPYTKNMDDYYAKVEFQLHSYSSGTGFTNSLFHTWEDLTADLLEDEDIGGYLKSNKKLLKQLSYVYAEPSTPKEKMIAIYDYLRANIKWNGRYTFLSKKNLIDILDKKNGNSAEINLILAIMLQDAGIETDLMLTSTRKNGFIVKSYPYIYRFNHLICRAKIGEDTFILDAKDEYRPYNITPQELINCTALVIHDAPEEWVNITANTTMIETVNAHIQWKTEDELMLTAKVMEKNEGYGAIIEKTNLEEIGEKAYANSLASEWIEGGEIENYKFQYKTAPKNTLIAQYQIDSDKIVSSDGTRLYFDTFAITGMKENPFTLEERLFPVDFNYPMKIVTRFMVDIPEGYTIEDLPKSSAVAMENKLAEFNVLYNQQANQIQVASTLSINEVLFGSIQYSALKDFFDKVVEKHGELIVFTKEE